MCFFTPYLLPGQNSLVLTMCSSLSDQESHNKQLLLFYKHSCIWSLTRSIFPLFLFPWNNATKEQIQTLSETVACFKSDAVQCATFILFARKLLLFRGNISAAENRLKTKTVVVCQVSSPLICNLTSKQERAKINQNAFCVHQWSIG